MQVRPTIVSESLLLRSPKASEGQGGALGEAEAIKRGNTVAVRDQVMDLVSSQGLKVSRVADNSLMPTPSVAHMRNHDEPIENYLERRQDFIDGKTKGMPGASLGVAVRMEVVLPTPKALDGIKGNLKTSQERIESGRQVDLPNVAIDLLGTPRTSSANGATSKEIINGAPKGRLEDQVLLPTPNTMEHREVKTKEQIEKLKRKSPGGYRNLREEVINEATSWGKFEPAIRRWEEVLGRTAPAPTKPDGKEGAHRLSSMFTEWMMGLPEGWITGHGLSRNDELKMAGNGVVPQQAELALRILLDGIELPLRGGK